MGRKLWALGGAGAVVVMIIVALVEQRAAAQANRPQVPVFEADPLWSQALPNKWVNGQVGGVAVDSHDNVWVFHRPATIPDGEKGASLTPPQSECCIPAPPLLEFDTNGKFLQAWGGPGQGYEWFSSEHAVFVDYKDNVWLSGNAKEDNQLINFKNKGKFLMQIGHAGKNRGSNDTENLGGPAGLFVYRKTNELFVADGYFNHRVIVFDADTGAYKRHWGAYGKPPTDEKITYDPKVLPQQFNNPVHGIRITADGQVVVSDRGNNRIQVFQKDGTFVREIPVLRDSTAPGVTGSTVFWPDKGQTYWFTSDDPNGQIHVIHRSDGELVGSFGRVGRGPGEFENLHNIAIDSKGNIYTAEVQGQRVQRFLYKGGLPAVGQ